MLVSLKKPARASVCRQTSSREWKSNQRLPNDLYYRKAALDNLNEGVENKVNTERVECQVTVEREGNKVKVEVTTLKSTATHDLD